MMVNENMVFKLALSGGASDISLSSVEWGIITQIDGIKTVGEIAKNLALTLDEAFAIFNSLRKKGLIYFDHEIEISVELVDEQFIKKVQDRLIKYIGPVAQYVITDVLQELKVEDNQIPKTQVPEFIEMLSEEISDEKKKINFQREMLKLLREL